MQYPKICIKLDKLPKRTSFWPDFVWNVTPVRSSNSFGVYQGLNSSDSSWRICAAHPSTLISICFIRLQFIRVSIDLVWGEILIDLICGWLACIYPGSSPSSSHMLLHFSLLSSARRSLAFWAGRPWRLLLWFSKGRGEGFGGLLLANL